MAIIYSYPTVTPTADDLVLGTDVNQTDKPTKNFTIQSIVDIVQGGAAGLGATIKLTAPLGDASDPATGANQPIVNLSSITGTGTASFAALTDGTATIQAGVGSGFTAFTSTAITGTLQTAAQPNVTSLGTLTSLTVNTSVTGTAVVTTLTAPGDNLKIASTKAIVDYIATNPPGAESLAATLLVGNTTGATKIEVDNTSGGIDFIDDAKLRLGTGDDFEMYHASADNKTYLKEAGASDLEIWSNKVAIKNAAGNEAILTGTENAAVELYYDNVKRFETLTAGAKVTGAFEATTTGTFAGVINSGAYTDSSGDVGSAGQVLKSTVTGTNWVTDAPLYTWTIEADSGAGSPYTVASGDTIDFVGGDNINTSWIDAAKELKIDVTGVVQKGTGAATQVAYWTDADTIAGDAGMVYDSANNNLTVSGTVQAGTLSDGTFSGTAGTYTGGVSITSTTFVGALTGNADTATALAATGSIGFGGDVTLSSAAPSATYTSGGNITFNLGLVNSAVTGQVLTGLPTPAAASIVASDTILEAFGKTQSQINSIANGLQYQGTWNATTNSPTLASGGGEATSGTTTATTANKLVDSGANFTATVTVGDKVINQVDGQTALVSNVDSATTLSIDADIMLTGEAYTIDNTPFITQGHYYVVSVAGSTALNGISDWVVGDWVIAGATNVWEKLDNTAVQGTGTANYLTKWNATGVSAIVDSGVTDDGSTIKLLNDVELGASASDTTLVKGPTTFDENVRFDKSISIGAAYGTAGQVFTSGGGAGAANTWTNISSWGYVESVTASTGITIGGTAVDPTVAITYAGASNAILAATGATPVAADTIWFSDADDSTIKKALISSLPLNNFLWIVEADSGTGSPYTVASGDTIDFVGVGNISTAWDAATKEIRISASENPGSGTQWDLPVWNTTSTLGDSMVKQNSGGTILTVESATPTLIINDTTTNKGNLAISFDDAAATYMSTGDTTAATFGTHIFRQTEGANPRTVMTLNAAGNVDLNGSINSSTAINTSGAVNSGNGTVGAPAYSFTSDTNTGMYRIGADQLGFATNGTVALSIDASQAVTFAGGITTGNGTPNAGSLTVAGGLTVNWSGSGGTTAWGNFSNITTASANTDASVLKINQKNTGGTDQTLEIGVIADGNAWFGSKSGSTITGVTLGLASGNVEISGNLTVDGQIIHGGTHGGGGTYYKEYTTGTVAAGAATAFTLTRATSGTLVFSVYLTATLATNKQVAKMYQVAHTYGQTPVYNKIIDTGPLGADITVAFADSSNTAVTCSIAAVTEDSQPVGITVIVGHGATAVTFA